MSDAPNRPILREETPMARVLEYKPKKFDLGVPQPAMEFQELRKRRGNDFRMSDPLRIQTGLDKLEEQDTKDQVERLAIEKLKEVQEGAYQEAYKLGLEEGRLEAFTKHSAAIEQSLGQFDELITAVRTLKVELTKQNESHMLKLVLHVANRLAHHEVEVNNDCVVDIIRKAVQDAQLDEEVTIQIAPQQFEFLEQLKKETGREFEFLKKVKFAPVEGIRPGGCVIETNYGVIDARFDERVGKLWETMSENLYRIKEKIGVA